MHRFKTILAAVFLASLAATASFAVDPNADIIYIREDCGTLQDCFSDASGTAIYDADLWTRAVRNPTVADPVHWDIGPGEFHGRLACEGKMSLAGAGRGATLIARDTRTDGGAESASVGTIRGPAAGCDHIDIRDLTVRSGTDAAAWWQANGSSTWTNVDLIRARQGLDTNGYSNAWYDDSCTGSDQPQHFFYGSQFIVTGKSENQVVAHGAIFAQCGDFWLYGSDVLNKLDRAKISSSVNVHLQNAAKFHMFGGSIRTVRSHANNTTEMLGVWARDSSTFHMHGGIISLNAGTGSNTAYGIWTDDSAFAHAPGTAFAAVTTGSVQRIEATGTSNIGWPFEWPASTTPPTSTTESNTLLTLDGQDKFVETDCGSDGDCSGAAATQFPHTMIYAASACGASTPWFDTVTNHCRE